MIDADDTTGFPRRRGDAFTVFGGGGQRFFHQDMAAQFEGAQRHDGVTRRRCQHVHCVDASLRKRIQRRVSARQTEALGQSLRAAEVEVGHADKGDVGQPSQRPHVELADVAGADEADTIIG